MKVSKIKYVGKIKVLKKPSKKTMRLTGKTVYDTYSNNIGKSVWDKQYKEINGYKIVVYELSKCDEEDCDGHLEIDKNGYKICNVCGLGTVDSNLTNIEIAELYKNSYYTAKSRNNIWDNNNLKITIFDKDIKATELLEANKRIIEWEKNNNDEIQKVKDGLKSEVGSDLSPNITKEQMIYKDGGYNE